MADRPASQAEWKNWAWFAAGLIFTAGVASARVAGLARSLVDDCACGITPDSPSLSVAGAGVGGVLYRLAGQGALSQPCLAASLRWVRYLCPVLPGATAGDDQRASAGARHLYPLPWLRQPLPAQRHAPALLDRVWATV